MPTPNSQAEQHIGETKGISNPNHDLIHDLSNRLDALWRYDQCIANAEKGGADDSKQLWQGPESAGNEEHRPPQGANQQARERRQLLGSSEAYSYEKRPGD